MPKKWNRLTSTPKRTLTCRAWCSSCEKCRTYRLTGFARAMRHYSIYMLFHTMSQYGRPHDGMHLILFPVRISSLIIASPSGQSLNKAKIRALLQTTNPMPVRKSMPPLRLISCITASICRCEASPKSTPVRLFFYLLCKQAPVLLIRENRS